MKRIIFSALVALTAFGGVASADRGHGNPRHAQGGVTVTPSSRGQWNRGYDNRARTYNRGYTRGYNRGYVSRPAYRYVRRPIYVRRPVIRYHYYNYYQRPAVLVENYSSMPGYYWVAGQWNWDGYEWIWTPGYYAPDPNAQGYYSNSYSNGYYEQNPSYDPNYNYDSY